MMGLRIVFFIALSSLCAHADPSGDGHVHGTAVGTGASQLSAMASRMPAQMLQGTSFEGMAAAPVAATPIPLSQPGRLSGNGEGALSVEDRIGKPGEESFEDAVTQIVPRAVSIPYGE